MKTKYGRAQKKNCFWSAMRPPVSFDRLSHWWSTKKECLFDCFPFYFRCFFVAVVVFRGVRGWGLGKDFIAYTAPMKINLCKAFVV